MAIDKEFYNEASSAKLGWAPSWFIDGHTEFDKKLTSAIRKFQKKFDLVADGMCGPTTYRRLVAYMESEWEFVGPTWNPTDRDVLYYNGNPIQINWPADKVHTFKDEGFPYAISEGFSSYRGEPRSIKSFVAHWDVCLHSEMCARVLKDRGISVHFCIDNDGTIIQLHDINDACWHAGNRKVNHSSVGVEISNGYYTKYNKWYEKNGFGKRNIVTDAKVNGKTLSEHLDFYPIQLQALKALMEAIHDGCGVPYKFPEDPESYDASTLSGNWQGFMNHFNCSKKKTDCGGLNLQKLLTNRKGEII